MQRFWKPVLALITVATAFCVTFVWPRQNSLDFDIDASPRARAARRKTPYNLAEVRVIKAVIIKVNQHYVEPERIVHRRMLLAALNAIQRSVAPVLIHHEHGSPNFRIVVNDKEKAFDAGNVNSPWALTWLFEQVFEFLQQHLQDEDIDLRDVEYAAVNGILRTLDPHSVLLSPEEYSEMQLSTRGEFGGLGIVISIRDGQLTIIRPMPGTPASKAGLIKRDRIVKINDESTLNMPLEEAVKRLRGAPGSTVVVWIVREGNGGWKKARRFDLTRAVIHIDSVESKMLADSVGYVRVLNFQSSTCADLRRSLLELRQQDMRGLVLDLRGNPGGLLAQAVCVADTFLPDGTIVTTSSNEAENRERRSAQRPGTEPLYPMVVLCNGGSASASEIVAGALKNHDRALVVGQQTFGKGSVQVLYSDENDGWALKLTIAQYLTPGDVSIQGVGIVPDIEIDPMTVDPLDMDLAVNKGFQRESDLSAHLTHARAHESTKPSVVLRYYLDRETRLRLREATPEDREENEQEHEFLTRFSRQLLQTAKRPGRRELLADAQPVIEAATRAEMATAVKELRGLGVDWSLGADQGPSSVRVQLSTNAVGNKVRAGESLELTAKVTNTGSAPLYRLRATTKSDYRLFAERELAFGRLDPAQSRAWTTTLGVCRKEDGKRTCALPKWLPDRADGIRVEFGEAHGHVPPPAEIRTEIVALRKPQFAYALHVTDAQGGNGNGVLERGESATVHLKVRNVGRGKSHDTQANLRNMSGRGILLRHGRFELGTLKPGEERDVSFTFDLLPDLDQPEVKVEISVADVVLREVVSETLKLAVAASAGAKPVAARGSVSLREGSVILESPNPNAKVVARCRGGSCALTTQAQTGTFTRVDIGKGRPAWVSNQQLAKATGDTRGKVAFDLNHMPPRLDVDYGHTLVTRKPSLRIRARAQDEHRVRDMYVFVGVRKVSYQSNRGTSTPGVAELDTEVPLRNGINYVTVVARESNDIMSRKTFVVRRDGADGSLLETPKMDDDAYLDEALGR